VKAKNLKDHILEHKVLGIDKKINQALFKGGDGAPATVYDEFVDLIDTPANYTGQAGKTVAVNAGGTALEFVNNVATDEKVKYDAGDPTAGYVADKIIAGTGISVAEGTGANENKLVVSSSITQYTDEMAQDAVGGILTDTATIDFTYDDATPKITADVKADSINDTHIDWGIGANQVNTDDVPEGTAKFDTYKAKVSSNDTTPNYLVNKILDGLGMTFLTLDGGDETITVNLGTPSTCTASSINEATDLSHTHAITGFLTAEADTLATVTGRGATTNTFIGLGQAPTATDTLAITNTLTTNNSSVIYGQKTGDVAGTSFGSYMSVTGNSTVNIAHYGNVANADTNVAFYGYATPSEGAYSTNVARAFVAASGDISITADKLLFGTLGSEDTNLYRVAANVLGTDDTLRVNTLTASKVVFTDASKNLTSTGIGTSSQFIKGDGSLDSATYLTAEADTLATVCGRGATYTADNVTLLGITIGANTLTTSEWAKLDGQDQAVKTTSNVTFGSITSTGNYIQTKDGTSLVNQYITYGTGVQNYLRYFRYRGSVASPAAVVNGDMVTSLAGYGYDGTTALWRCGIDFVVNGTVDDATDAVPMDIDFRTGTTANPTVRFSIKSNGSCVVAAGALATSATDGFLYIPSCAGTPTGTPTTYTGRLAMIYDSTNNKLYIYNGAWKSATFA